MAREFKAVKTSTVANELPPKTVGPTGYLAQEYEAMRALLGIQSISFSAIWKPRRSGWSIPG